MDASDIPYKFGQPWAASATAGYLTDPIPATASGGNASQAEGFPPVTSVPIGSGGAYPLIEDINGLGFYATAWAQWQQAGGPVFYDAAFSTAIGGYPAGALIANASTPNRWWVSLADDNVTDPDTGGAGWDPFPAPHGVIFISATGSYDVTIPAGMRTAKATVGGGGGAGAGGDGTGGGGGGGGGAIGTFWLTGLVPGQHITGAIGVGGTAGTSGGGAGGNGGGTTLLVNAVLLATMAGGTGGAFTTNPSGGAGGAVSIGTFAGTYIALTGSWGTDGYLPSVVLGGNGAPGWQGAGAGRGGSGGGEPAAGYSAGGGGSYGALAGAGGAGSSGFVLIEY